MKSPYSWFGGKSRVAEAVWQRLGNTGNYIEPFFGSGAILLSRPHDPGVETINDNDRFVANFWRSIQADPVKTAEYANWPINETDLHSRHEWLISHGAFRLKALDEDPDAYDPKIAGWWVWGISAWFGKGWCLRLKNGKTSRQIPNVGNGGTGINRTEFQESEDPLAAITQYFQALQKRLRNVRVCCGDWGRVLTNAVTTAHGTTAVFLDPPYGLVEHSVRYNSGGHGVAKAARQWAIEHGSNKNFRIALCGYEGEHQLPSDWQSYSWSTSGGFAMRDKAVGNAHRERIWFSPHCLRSNIESDKEAA